MDELIRKMSILLDEDFEKLKKHFNNDFQFIEFEPSYFRFKRRLDKIAEGTTVFLSKTGLQAIHGYPEIPRALVIKTAFKKNFNSAFVEEKMNGYNVRTALIDNELLAITRKGLVCNYTAKRIEDEINIKFFEENQNLVLCGEVVGMQNPYQEKSYPEDKNFGYYIFDIMEKNTGKFLTIIEKQKLLKKYRLKSVKNFGVFKDSSKILKLTRELGKKGREGVVIKSADNKKKIKYTANQSTNDDLKYAFRFYEDYGIPFMFTRLVREAFQAYELKLKGKALEKEAAELGKSILFPMIETIKKIEQGKNVTEDFDITIPDEEFGIDFVENLKHLGVNATIRNVKKAGKNVIMTVSRNYPSTSDSTKHYLKGGFTNDKS